MWPFPAKSQRAKIIYGFRLLSFQSLGRDSVHSSCPGQHQYGEQWRGFNPSVGILFIQAPLRGYNAFIHEQFQSLGRDSVHSSLSEQARLDGSEDVSIPRSGFCSFKPYFTYLEKGERSSFNPSVGILFIQASYNVAISLTPMRFQSLGRDSVHSSYPGDLSIVIGEKVSIPRSGFCSFKLYSAPCHWLARGCFNPSVGILFIQATNVHSHT